MLTSTFLHTPGIGQASEKSLWRQGARDWQTLLDCADRLRVAPGRREALRETVAESICKLRDGRVDWFARRLPSKEHWRAVSAFPRLGFLDIETDGGMAANSVTVIGLSDGFDCRCYVKGVDIDEFVDDCLSYDGFVTFFGGGFDIPFLKRRFPHLESAFAERLHLDLCPMLKRLGHKGGLKRIEAQLGISRVPEADGLDGLDAVRLWQEYRRGGRSSDDALRQLLAYNKEDVLNMKLLLEYALPRLQELTGYNELPSSILEGVPSHDSRT